MVNYSKIVSFCISLLAVVFLVSACDGSACRSCTDGQPCPDFVGEYYGTIEELSDNCIDWDLVVGDHYLRILNTTEVDGRTTFDGESKDMRGVWGTVSGEICNTDDTEYPMQYAFSYSDSDFDDDGSSTTYQFNGSLIVPVRDDRSSYSFSGTLIITNTSAGGNSCTLVGSISGDMI